jgi:diguanylate cyclase (GGDEF)-like protein
MGCVAFGNLGVDDLGERIEEMLALARELDSPWEEAIALNDLGHFHMSSGDPEGAEAHLAAGLRVAAGLEHSTFATTLLHATHSELQLSAGRAREAVAAGRRAVALAGELGADVNPYLLGMAVVGLVQALLALGRFEEARLAGDAALERLGDGVPQARSMILSAVAEALREAGRPEDAYDALARGAELERQALREFAQLQRGLERARAENAKLQALVEELAEAHAELHRRSEQLEVLQEQLRDQADRDHLTGLRNRRYLAREGMPSGTVSLALLDLDHFKAVNDRFGHLVGDHVLVRVADLLVENVRGEDVVVRTGGEEFAVLMPLARQEEAVRCCERLCSVIASEPWDRIARGLRVTASIGVASTSEGRRMGELEQIADERLYAAKRAGRDRVEHGRAAA